MKVRPMYLRFAILLAALAIGFVTIANAAPDMEKNKQERGKSLKGKNWETRDFDLRIKSNDNIYMKAVNYKVDTANDDLSIQDRPHPACDGRIVTGGGN